MDLKEGTKIPIYITPQDGDHVKVFNYLMKNAKVTKSLPISKVRVKPNQDLTELRLDLRQETQYFSLEKAQEIADTSGLFKKEATPDEQCPLDASDKQHSEAFDRSFDKNMSSCPKYLILVL
ncbi:uncharacterized protein LOC136025799 [Artemia franciscana]|uniref:uncharacterized protein LOC136025799 n=1 Tax=Artemia franciscana TaxID=6661 RepID=UPI0032DA45AE